jgi:hypothetical protein
MINYNRDISVKLFITRALFIFIVILISELFSKNFADYGIVLAFVIFTLSFFPITALSINTDSVEIKKYYLFGFLPFSWTLFKHNIIKVYPWDIELESDEDATAVDTESALELLIPLAPKRKLKVEMFIIKYFGKNGNANKLRQRLTKSEFDLISDMIRT